MPKKTLSDLKVLVVDDEMQNIELLTEILDMSGCENIFSTTSVNEAIEKYEAESFDLVLLDLNMPEMSGFDVLREFSKVDKKPSPKVIVLSGHREDEIEQQAIECGADGFMSKPFGISEIISFIESTILDQ